MSKDKGPNELSEEETKLKLFWTLFISHLKSPKGKIDLGYIWTDEAKVYLLKIKKELGKITFILGRLHLHYKADKEKYKKEITDIKNLLKHISKIKPSRQWIMVAHNELLEIIRDIENEKGINNIRAQIEKGINDLSNREKLLNIEIVSLKKTVQVLNQLKDELFLLEKKTEVRSGLEREISEKKSELENLPRSWLGKVKDKARESDLTFRLASLQKEISGFPERINTAESRSKKLIEELRITKRISYDDVIRKISEINLRIEQIECEKRELILEIESSKKEPGLIAYGGNGYVERRRIGQWGIDRLGLFQELYALDIPRNPFDVSFGMCRQFGRLFIIIRQRQNIENRGGYPYTLLLDPGEVVWHKARWNSALIVKNILHDPYLHQMLLLTPEKSIAKDIFSRLENTNLSAKPVSSPKIEQLWRQAENTQTTFTIGPKEINKLDPESLAASLESIPENLRKRITYLIGGGKVYGEVLGCLIVWDPKKI